MAHNFLLNTHITFTALKKLRRATLKELEAETGFTRDSIKRHLSAMGINYEKFANVKIFYTPAKFYLKAYSKDFPYLKPGNKSVEIKRQ